MPEHDTYGEKYTFKGAESDKFTYHHIIPENRLKLAIKQLDAILKTEPKGTEADELRSEAETVKATGRNYWAATRATDLTHYVNKQFEDYSVSLDSDVVLVLIRQYTTIGPLFDAVLQLAMDQIKRRVSGQLTAARARLIRDTKTLLRRPEHEWYSKVDDLVDKITIDGFRVFDAQLVKNAIKSAPPAVRGSRKGNITRAVEQYARDWTFKDFEGQAYPSLRERRVGATQNLWQIVRDYGLPADDQDELQDAITWIPGNIHRGPEGSTRLDPKDAQFFDKLRDDGGNTFEFAAANLVGTEHFARLGRLNEKVEALIKVKKQDLGKTAAITLAGEMLAEVHALQLLGLTQYNPAAWQEETVGGSASMRLVRNEERLRAAGLLEGF